MPLRRILRAFAALAILVVLGLGALFAALWLEHTTAVTTLPAPTGPFAVGRSMDAWVDNLPDTLAPIPGTKRELVVWIWYPSLASPSATITDDYLPLAWRAAIERARGVLISRFLTRDLARVHAHTTRNSAVSPEHQSYPVAIMRAGASLEVANYSTLAEDLASHGYVVVAFDAPYRTSVVVFPDSRVITRRAENDPELCLGRPDQERCADRLLSAWTADISFVLDRLQQLNVSDPSGRFTGRLDMTRVGVFGHSFGGAAAALFCAEDSRCQAGIDLDGAPHGSVIQTGLHRPFLFLLSDHGYPSDRESREVMANIDAIYARLPRDERLRIAIRGANHFTFSDDGALLKSHIILRTLRALGILGIDGRRQLAITTYYVHTFFDVYLKGANPSLLKIPSPLYPEVRIGE